MKVINSYYIFSSLVSNITKHCTTANAPILRFKRFLRTPLSGCNRVCPYKRTSEQITYATQGWFSAFYNSLVTIHPIVISISCNSRLPHRQREKWLYGPFYSAYYHLKIGVNTLSKKHAYYDDTHNQGRMMNHYISPIRYRFVDLTFRTFQSLSTNLMITRPTFPK